MRRHDGGGLNCCVRRNRQAERCWSHYRYFVLEQHTSKRQCLTFRCDRVVKNRAIIWQFRIFARTIAALSLPTLNKFTYGRHMSHGFWVSASCRCTRRSSFAAAFRPVERRLFLSYYVLSKSLVRLTPKCQDAALHLISLDEAGHPVSGETGMGSVGSPFEPRC